METLQAKLAARDALEEELDVYREELAHVRASWGHDGLPCAGWFDIDLLFWCGLFLFRQSDGPHAACAAHRL
jgi:hypothetical protein